MKKISIIIAITIILFIINIFWSTGYFRIIENKFEGEILKKINIVGAEDITINHIDSFAIVSSTNRKSFPAKKNKKLEGYIILILKKLIQNLYF